MKRRASSQTPIDVRRVDGDHYRRRSRVYHEKRRRARLIKQLSLAVVPFVLVLVGLLLISIGFFRYVENESVLALFLLNRDSAALHDFSGDAWGEVTPTVEETLPEMESHTISTEAENSGERLKVPFYYIGQQFASLRIPSIDVDLPVFQGDREREFSRGVGHFPGSFFPGQNGNILLAAHRTGNFRTFEYIEAGDPVHMETTYGTFVYQVDEIRITDGDDMSIAANTSTERLTMYTCYPFEYFGNAPQRYVVICSLVESEVNAG